MNSIILRKKLKGLFWKEYVNSKISKNSRDIKRLQYSVENFIVKNKTSEIYFDGQMYDAYSKIVDIFKSAKKELIIVDGYADKTVLDMIKDLKINVKLIVKENMLLKKLDIKKYNEQYSNLKIKYDNTFHDRYFVIDDKFFYHCGASLNKIGYRTFSITLLNDKDVCKQLLSKINS